MGRVLNRLLHWVALPLIIFVRETLRQAKERTKDLPELVCRASSDFKLLYMNNLGRRSGVLALELPDSLRERPLVSAPPPSARLLLGGEAMTD